MAKLTLNVDAAVVARAKRYAARRGLRAHRDPRPGRVPGLAGAGGRPGDRSRPDRARGNARWSLRTPPSPSYRGTPLGARPGSARRASSSSSSELARPRARPAQSQRSSALLNIPYSSSTNFWFVRSVGSRRGRWCQHGTSFAMSSTTRARHFWRGNQVALKEAMSREERFQRHSRLFSQIDVILQI